ncbi:precorrin-3B synthase [Acetobacter tropicalis]|uniref:Precorrin-3B synthase n=1 Tax=Acetobacter tropicalis TaxID=104102 RepID=A0A511FR34_9PROT|nr:precorrin-3B synthase [Acetobacter tropicalis]KXV50995.1 precorrin-3B synthase [Acetobacter tropicalis]GEL51340.1 precorrin-3B synthase [Acetobacter tropicalis]
MSRHEVKGWCPGILRPMASGDGLLVRLRSLTGRLTQEQAAGIAYLAQQFGNGLIDLSARATLHIRGVTDRTYQPLVMGLTHLGLTDPTPEAEARRNCIVTPYWEYGDGTVELAEKLAKALQEQETLLLPRKFGFALDSGSSPVLRDVSADIRIERDTTGALICRPDGAVTGACVTPESVVDTALSLAKWFIATGGESRMAAHLAHGVRLPRAFMEREAAPEKVMVAPVPHRSSVGILVALPFGQMEASLLAALASIAPLRLTPWRMVLLEGQSEPPVLDHIITNPRDPLLRVAACTGAPGCSQALRPTRPLARALASHVPPAVSLHVSGCTKGCAHPAKASLTLVAETDGFGLIRNGNACAAPSKHLLSPEMLLEDPDALFL